jgi:hypothetical protein
LYAFLIVPLYATFPEHIILLALITRKMFGEEYKLWSFLQPSVTCSLLGLNILLSALFPDTLNLCSSLKVRGQVFTPILCFWKPYNDTTFGYLTLNDRNDVTIFKFTWSYC